MKIRAGLANQAKFIDNVRDAIIAVEMNEVRAYTPPADASMSAWYRFQSPGGAFPISVHQQGNMLANLIDLSVRQDTQGAASLDDVVRSLYQDFYLKGKGYSTEDLIGVINRITKKDYKDFFAKYVQGVDVPPYDTILGYAGYKLERVAVPAPIMGFRMATTNDGPVVSFITPGSPAEEGGVQLGDMIVTIDEMDVRKAGHALPGLKDWLTPKIGQTVDVVIKRNGVDKTLKVKVGSRDEFTLKVSEVSQPTPEQLKIRAGWMGGSATGGVAAAK
jgi:predicted metalloprotease with PDZ domain